MKATVTVTGRGVITLPAKLRQALEIYTDKRIAEFDAAEADLAKALSRRKKRRR
jgi:bifunctional DNA-binding transcriptional regulator/antitoxin component of YhaV-PrlF toxin-antitoxin module